MPGKGEILKGKGWPARKFYISPEAFELMRKHCDGTPLTMSAYVDSLIKRDLDPKPETILYGGARSGGNSEVPAMAAERARKAALNTSGPLLDMKQPTKKDFDLDI